MHLRLSLRWFSSFQASWRRTRHREADRQGIRQGEYGDGEAEKSGEMPEGSEKAKQGKEEDDEGEEGEEVRE